MQTHSSAMNPPKLHFDIRFHILIYFHTAWQSSKFKIKIHHFFFFFCKNKRSQEELSIPKDDNLFFLLQKTSFPMPDKLQDALGILNLTPIPEQKLIDY